MSMEAFLIEKQDSSFKLPLGVTRFNDEIKARKCIKCIKRRFRRLFAKMECNAHSIQLVKSDAKPFNPLRNVDASTIKGKCLSKNKTEPPSKMTIDDNLAVISKANFIEPEQACLGFSFPS